MKETKEVKNLRSKILGMELELNILSKDLERFETELLYNEKMLKATLDNLIFLTNSSQIVSLSEYKKINQQLRLVKTRIEYYNLKITPLKLALFIKQSNHKEEMERFEYAYRMQFKNNILEFPNNGRKEA